MSRKMTVVFHDEGLYTYLKVEAARRHRPASEIVSEAVQEWLSQTNAKAFTARKATGKAVVSKASKSKVGQYIEGYKRFPETAEEVAAANSLASESLAREPW